jgi:hypothetical protein
MKSREDRKKLTLSVFDFDLSFDFQDFKKKFDLIKSK